MQQLADPEGQYLLLKGKLGNLPITLTNVYFPDTAYISFCRKIVHELSWFASECIVLGGEFRYSIGSSSGHLQWQISHCLSHTQKNQGNVTFSDLGRFIECD